MRRRRSLGGDAPLPYYLVLFFSMNACKSESATHHRRPAFTPTIFPSRSQRSNVKGATCSSAAASFLVYSFSAVNLPPPFYAADKTLRTLLAYQAPPFFD